MTDDFDPQKMADDAERLKRDNEEMTRLLKMSALDRDRAIEASAKTLGVSERALRAELTKRIKSAEADKQSAKSSTNFLPHWDVEPWPDPVDGAELLGDLRNHFKRHVVMPRYTDVAIPLWVLHTWVFDCFDITPYLAITSPTRRCGKTLLMTMLYWLCCRAKKNDSMSKAAIYRSVDRDKPTLCLDEVSWVVDLKDERQNILCGGFERLGYAEVCDGEGADITARLFSTFCPKAFGLIGKLTATLMDRSIEISMQRKLKEKVERLRRRDNAQHAEFRRKFLRWAADNRQALETIRPTAPAGLNDRAFDAWEPLLAVAGHASGDWLKSAIEAAIALSGGEMANEERSVELLADFQAIFEKTGRDEIKSKVLLDALIADEERPWATWNKGKPISYAQITALLKHFSIVSETIHPPGEAHGKGYKKARFLDAFERYLTSPEPATAQNENLQPCGGASADKTGTSDTFSGQKTDFPHGSQNSKKPANDGGLHPRTAKYPPVNETNTNGGSGAPFCFQCKSGEGVLHTKYGVPLHEECVAYYLELHDDVIKVEDDDQGEEVVF